MIKKYRKKPVVIEAIKLTADNYDSVSRFLWYTPTRVENKNGKTNYTRGPYSGIRIETLEGIMIALNGDYIIKGIKGEFYPCKPDIFEQTYDKVL